RLSYRCSSSAATPSGAACVEVDSDTKAVVNKDHKLGCIFCKKRGEVAATAVVKWYFKGPDDNDSVPLYIYQNKEGSIIDPRFYDRLLWSGSRDTEDLQDGSISILNVTYGDIGTYRCFIHRSLRYANYAFDFSSNRTIQLTVEHKLTRELASTLSEVMMYVSIIGLQVWLVVEMIYCYRKISAAGEEALRESEADYLAVASESKENCAAVQVSE
uniref:Sodium channel regulatory subunit beta-3 n=1 Tax=Kryptolebias marmoratus TaxID=37003 RepID=A0A3Q3A0D2_KRYMA